MAITNVVLNSSTWTSLTSIATQVRISSVQGSFAVAAAAAQPTTVPTQTWQPDTPYAVGATVINGGNVYTCTVAGNSSKKGVGPSGTGTGIKDGGVTWNYTKIVDSYEVVGAGVPGNTYTSAVQLWGLALGSSAIACVVDKP